MKRMNERQRTTVIIVAGMVLLVLAAAIAYAGTVQLAWDEYTDQADGIRIYASKQSPVAIVPGNMVAAVIGKSTNRTTINNLPNGRMYFVATSYATVDGNELESGPSNEVTTVLIPSRVENLTQR